MSPSSAGSSADLSSMEKLRPLEFTAIASTLESQMVSFVTNVDAPVTEAETKDTTKLSDVWNVIVLNDPVNLMSYVAMVFERVLNMSKSQAEKHMMEVHQLGRSVVWTGDREKAETYVYQLQEWHLTAILERNEAD